MRFDVLNKGFVELVDYMGDDLTVVNSARVSFGKRKDELDDDDIRLINYLAKNAHDSPFRHVQFQLHIKAPEFVMRQWYKHVVGAEATSSHPVKDHAWNEISQRYTEVDEFYIPDTWREQSTDSKQASGGEVDDPHDEAGETYIALLSYSQNVYQRLLDIGVAREQARIILPLSVYTEVYWTASFQALMNFIELRDNEHAQWEIQQYAKAVKEIVRAYVPASHDVWEKHRL